MAGLEELNGFVHKFIGLWAKGIRARLQLETETGNAFINIHAELGLACFLSGQHPEGATVLVEHVFGVKNEELLPDSK